MKNVLIWTLAFVSFAISLFLISCSNDSEPVPFSHRVYVEGIDFARETNWPASIYAVIPSSGASITGHFEGTFAPIVVNKEFFDEVYELWPWTNDYRPLKCDWGEVWYDKEEDKDGFTVSHITIYPNNDTKPRQLSFGWGTDGYYFRLFQEGRNPRLPEYPDPQPDVDNN